MIRKTSNQRFLTVLIVFLHYTGTLIIVPTLPGLVVSQTWHYQGQIEKMLVPMVFLKYDRLGIQSKVFDGATCIPALYRLLKNWANITRYCS